MIKTKKFEFLPGIEFEFSTVTSYGVKAQIEDYGYGYRYNNDQKFIVDKDEKNASYITWVSKDNDKNELYLDTGYPNYQYGYHTPKSGTVYLHVFPNKAIYNKMAKKYKHSTVIPMIVPIACDDVDSVFEHIVKNEMAYDYKGGAIANGFYPSLQLHVAGAKRKSDVFNETYYGEKAHKSAYNSQKQILHTIIMNEFVKFAIDNDNYSLTLRDYLKDKENIEHVQNCLSKFELSSHDYVEIVVKFFAKNNHGRCGDKHFLRYSLYEKSVENKEALLSITATSVINTLKASNVSYMNSDKEPEKLFLQKYYIPVKNNVYNMTEIIKQSIEDINSLVVDGKKTKVININELDCTDTKKVVNSKNNHDVFTTSNIEDMTRILLEGRIASCIDGLLASKEEGFTLKTSINTISSASQSLHDYVKVKRSNSMIVSLVTIFNAIGYDYLRYHVRPTELAALIRLARIPTMTLKKSKQLSNMLKFFELNLVMDMEDKSYKNSRDYMFGIIYKIVMDMKDVVFDASTVDSSLKEITEGFLVSNVPIDFVCNILFTDFNEKSRLHYDEKHDKGKIDALRAVGM